MNVSNVNLSIGFKSGRDYIKLRLAFPLLYICKCQNGNRDSNYNISYKACLRIMKGYKLNYDQFINLDFNSNVKTHADCRMLMKYSHWMIDRTQYWKPSFMNKVQQFCNNQYFCFVTTNIFVLYLPIDLFYSNQYFCLVTTNYFVFNYQYFCLVTTNYFVL